MKKSDAKLFWLYMLVVAVLTFVLVWFAVNYQKPDTFGPFGNAVNPPKVEHLPPPVVSVMPPPKRLPSQTVYINVDGRKAYLQSLSVWWEDSETFEDISFWKLGKQLRTNP